MPYIYNAHSPKNDRTSINYLHCLDSCEITFFLRQKGKLLTTFQSNRLCNPENDKYGKVWAKPLRFSPSIGEN